MYSLKRFLCVLLAVVVLLFQLSSVDSAPYNDILQPTNAPASRQLVKNLLKRVVGDNSNSNDNSDSIESSEERQPHRQPQRY
uniref:Putative secreted protein n=1 Tax=Anopheles darlingi TaxID=43151 RepID=A0A2M4DQH9_ANODA